MEQYHSSSILIDVTNCDREPIHIPGSIQPHGVLIALRPQDLHIVQVSANSAEWLGLAPRALLGRPLEALIGANNTAALRDALERHDLDANPVYVWELALPGHPAVFDGIAHLVGDILILELDSSRQLAPPSLHPYRTAQQIITGIDRTTTFDAAAAHIAQEVRALTGFDRVMVYKFQPDETGLVVAESRVDDRESFLGLRYPASDIPRQARALYLRNWLRLIPDVGYEPVGMVADAADAAEQPLDMSYTSLRSVSPVHIQYLHNMGVRSSMSVSLVVNGYLWGLVAFHHYRGPHFLPYDMRSACELIGRFASSHITALQHREEEIAVFQRSHIQSALVAQVAASTALSDGLGASMLSLRAFFESGGVAVCAQGIWSTEGTTPPLAALPALVAWLAQQPERIIPIPALSREYAPAQSFVAAASGMLALALSPTWQTCILWFRPEIIQTVTWGGDPNKQAQTTTDGVRLSPRTSFAAWREQLRGSSAPWTAGELAAAHALHAALLIALLHRAEAIARHNTELARSNAELENFAYIASHDLREPLRGIHNYAAILIEDYGHALDAAGVAKLETLTRLTRRMELLIESLLSYSRVGRLDLVLEKIDLNDMLHHVRDDLRVMLEETGGQVRVPHLLPVVRGDGERIGEVFHNLLINALKYNDHPNRWVEITFRPATSSEAARTDSGPFVAIAVRDNGIGIAAAHHDDVFRLFQRLHARTAYGGGIGAGLTITRRIIERHGGRIWIESAPGAGSTFWFTLPWARPS